MYAQRAGAVAAPTAGLHFDEALLEKIADKGVERAFVTLHVGAGTFQPVRVDKIEDHHMHKEWLEVGQDVVDAIEACRARGGRVIAVGTTSVRSLESAARDGVLKAFSGDTDIFIYPGRPFHVSMPGHQLPSAGVHAADAGLGFRRLPRDHGCLRSGGRARVPLLQLR